MLCVFCMSNQMIIYDTVRNKRFVCVCVLFSQNSKWNEWCKKQKTNRNQWMRWFMDKWRGNQIETEIKLQTNNIEILAEFKNVSRHKIGSNGCFSVFYVE